MLEQKFAVHFVSFAKPYMKLLFVLQKCRRSRLSIKNKNKETRSDKKTINNMITSLEIIMERLDWFNETFTHLIIHTEIAKQTPNNYMRVKHSANIHEIEH
jgi:hypothetical protein